MSGRKPKRLRLTPSWLPTIRDHLVANGRRTMSAPGFEGMLDSMYGEMDALASASLWWVGEEMCQVVRSSIQSGEIPPIREMPAAYGLIVFDGGAGTVDAALGDATLSALSWRTGPGGSLICRPYTTDDRYLGMILDKSLPLAPLRAESDKEHYHVLLHATLSLMHEPGLSQVRPAVWDQRRDGMMPRSLNGQASRVKIITLREPPKTTQSETGDGTRRACEYRYVVQGFWRNQPHGPRNSLRRRQWIPPFIKGPAGAPLVIKEPVHAWTRL